jgi:hypothetical protein
MLEYIANAGDTFVALAKYFFGNDVHAAMLGKFNKVNDHKQEIKQGTKVRIPPKIISHAKTSQEKGKTIFHMEYGFRNCLTDSVGENGKNNSEDVMLVQKRLRELGYPGKDAVGQCGVETIKAVKFFQVFNCSLKMDYYKFDGRIDPKGKTEEKLFSKQPEKYKEIEKGDEKDIQADVKDSIQKAKDGTDEIVKGYWEKIVKVWKEVGPYLPKNSILSSGYRDPAAQREQLRKKYVAFKDDIISTYDNDTWVKNVAKMEEKLSDSDLENFDVELHTQICKVKSSREVALPGKSPHQKGRAIDVAGASDRLERIRALGFYLIKFENTAFVSAINNETNCVHFEFD